MPAKNAIKQYVEGGYYHIYNRGVEKRDIFIDDKDYRVFLYFLKLYLTNPEYLDESRFLDNSLIERANLHGEIDLLSYCLMPNHFHLLVKQNSENSVAKFMRCIATNYSMYFNKRYNRVGTLFQGRYKAVLVDRDEYLVHLSRYIHTNPLKINNELRKLEEYPYSSYKYYSDQTSPSWLKSQSIFEFFDGRTSYKKFVEDKEVESIKLIRELALD